MTHVEKVSLSRLATQIGVSPATVSRVLNNRRGIGVETRRRVLEAARESGYRPRVAVRKRTVGLVIDHPSESRITGIGFPETLTMRVVEGLARHRLAVEIFTSGNLDVLPDRLVDGVLAVAWQPETLRALQNLENTPMVIFNRPEQPEFSNVQVDDREIGRLAAQHLLEHGHRRLGLMAHKPDREATDRLEGFRTAIEAAGLQLPDASVYMASVLSPYVAAQSMRAAGITGVFVSCEHLAIEFPFVCAEMLGIELPSEMSMVGVGVETALKYHRPPMTLVALPANDMAQIGIDLLTDLIDSGDPNTQTREAAPKLVVRASVTAPAKI